MLIVAQLFHYNNISLKSSNLLIILLIWQFNSTSCLIEVYIVNVLPDKIIDFCSKDAYTYIFTQRLSDMGKY